MILCQACQASLNSRKCFGCGNDISLEERGLRALGKDWHIACFVCVKCLREFPDQSAFLCINLDPVCSTCAGLGEMNLK